VLFGLNPRLGADSFELANEALMRAVDRWDAVRLMDSPDGWFCEPELTNAGYRITAVDPGAMPVHSREAAIEQARVHAGNDSGSYDAYFASVRNPAAANVGLGDPETARTTWVVEASDVMPPPRSTDVHLRGGPPNPNISGPYRMVIFVDDATLARASAWAACSAQSAGVQSAGAAQGDRLDRTAVVRLDGVGHMRIGMTLAEVRRVAGDGANPSHPPACPFLLYPDAGAVITLTASQGELVDAVTVAGGDFRTDAGVGVGSSIEDLGRAYGPLNIHGRVLSINGVPALPGGRFIYLPDDPALSAYAMAFEVEGGVVRSIRSGLRDRVMTAQAC